MLLLLGVGFGCASDEMAGIPARNVPPRAWLAIAPPEGSTVDYRVHMYWGGFDPDGKVSHFEYAITDNQTGVFDPADTTGADKWRPTGAKDSVFTFTADVADSASIKFDDMEAYEFRRPHTFFIRAVDDRGARSKAVYRSFTARNLSPVVSIDVPRALGSAPSLVPPMITFKWHAVDYGGTKAEVLAPDSVRSILVPATKFGGRTDLTMEYVRKSPNAPEWTQWIAYDAPGDSGRFWRPENPLGMGNYVFGVQAKDEVGAVSPVFDLDYNFRLLRVTDRSTGPVLIVTNKFLGTVSTSTTKTPETIMNLPAGTEVSFTWSADASSYGGVVTGYRYGWDVLDLNDEEEWEVGWTPFVGSTARSKPRSFYYGTHSFHVEVEDNSGSRSRVPVTLNIVDFTMEKPLLLIDDWAETGVSFYSSGGMSPSDEEHDAFWADMLRNVAGFSLSADVLPYRGSLAEVPLTVLARYRTVIWNARSDPLRNGVYGAALESAIGYGRSDFNSLSLFLAAGGKMLLCGDHATTASLDKIDFPRIGSSTPGPIYPLLFRYEVAGGTQSNSKPAPIGDNSFPYDDCCANVIDLTYGINFSKPRRFCPVLGARTWDPKTIGLRAAVPADETYPFPRLELRPEVTDVGKWFQESVRGLSVDLFNPPYLGAICAHAELSPPRSCFQPMYTLECLDTTASVFGSPVAYWTSRWAHIPDRRGVAARSAILGFSPVFFKPPQVREALEIILFDEWKLERSVEARGLPQTGQQ